MVEADALLESTSHGDGTRRAALLLGVVSVLVNLIFGVARAQSSWPYAVFMLAVLLAAIAMERRRPPWTEGHSLVVLVAAIVAIVAATSTHKQSLVAASPLMYLVAVSLLASLLGSTRLVLVTTGLCCVGLAWTAWHVPFAGEQVWRSLSNLLLLSAVRAGYAAAQFSAEKSLRAQASSLVRARRSELALTETINRLLFSDFRAPLDRIRVLLASAVGTPLDCASVEVETARMRDVLARGRTTVLRSDRGELGAFIDTSEAAIRGRAFSLTVVALLAGQTLALVRNLVLGGGPILLLVCWMAVILGVLVRYRRRPPSRAVLTAITVLSCVMQVVLVRHWGGRLDAPSLVVQPGIAYLVYALCGPALGVAHAGLAIVGLLGLLWINGPTSENVTAVLNLTLLTGFTVTSAWLYWRALRADIVGVESDSRAFAEATRHRLRLTATLFHDQANLLALLSMIGEDHTLFDEADRDQLLALVDRMLSLLDAVQRINEADDRVNADTLRGVSAGALFDGIALLFDDRLRKKGQRLLLEGDRGVSVHAIPAVVLDSVLSNLVSNAIKFTPKGGTIRVIAQPSAGQTDLTVRDQGPGFPPELRDQLKRAERLTSTAGTAGEQGHGYGLLLAADFARRMGGELRIGPSQGSGGEVTVRFPASA